MTTKSATEQSLNQTANATFSVTGLSCADCASQFERDVQRQPEVQSASLNFGAAKITLTGSIDEATLRRIAASHGLGVVPADGKMIETPSRVAWELIVAGTALIVAWIMAASDVPMWSRTVFYVTAILFGGWKTFGLGLRALASRRLDMNTLMLVAVTGAVIIGEWNEAAVVSILFGLSHLLEARSIDRVRDSIRELTRLAPESAVVKCDGRETTVPVDEIQVGDILVVRPGDRFPLDGEVVLGQSSVNQAAITGESIPVHVGPGSTVYAGTVNEQGYVEVNVTKPVGETALARIVHLVEEAQAGRAPAQRFVDRFAAVYTPLVMVAALLTTMIPPLLAGAEWGTWVYRGLALLVVACPCALVVSTPVTLLSAIGAGARRGVLIKGGAHLEAMADVKAVAFDKTGTLTAGVPQVHEFVTLPSVSPADVLSIAASIEQRSGHPLATAIIKYAEEQGARIQSVDEFTSHLGLGVSATIGDVPYFIGNRRFLREHGVDITALSEAWNVGEARGMTVIGVADSQRILGILGIADTIRPEAGLMARELRALGIEHLVMLTGDNDRTAHGIADQIGFTEYRAEMLPDQKASAIEELIEEYGSVAMIGDGVNDAPALATASVGVAMGAVGSDTALETADVVLMSDNISLVPFTLRLSRKALRVVKQNITLSLLVKAIAVVLVYPGWLTLWLAILGDMGATLLVTLNGARLLAWGRHRSDHELELHKGNASLHG